MTRATFSERRVIETLHRQGEELPCPRNNNGTFAPGATLKHGLSFAPEYRIWIAIRARCNNSRHSAWKYYGGRGIRVCEEWDSSFEQFFRDMGKRPTEKHSIDRTNVNGNYESSNCRWVTSKVQGRNKRNHHFVEFNGRTMTLAEAVERCPHKLKYNTILYRIKRGWPVERALEKPRQ